MAYYNLKETEKRIAAVRELLRAKGYYYRLYTRQYEDEATSSVLA